MIYQKRNLETETLDEKINIDNVDKANICNTYIPMVRCKECMHLNHKIYACWNCGNVL